jgi:hypothetical protein
MWGWIVTIIIVVIVLAVGGGITNGTGGSPFLPGGCAGCHQVLTSWWHSLNFFQHIWYFPFYVWKLTYCATSDC